MKMIFTTGEVARLCKVAPRTVAGWFDKGRLKGYRIPGSQDRRIPREALLDFAEANNIRLDLEEAPPAVLVVGTLQGFAVALENALPAGWLVECAAGGFDAGIMSEAVPNIVAALLDTGLGEGTVGELARALRLAHPGIVAVALVGEGEAAWVPAGCATSFRRSLGAGPVAAYLAERLAPAGG